MFNGNGSWFSCDWLTGLLIWACCGCRKWSWRSCPVSVGETYPKLVFPRCRWVRATWRRTIASVPWPISLCSTCAATPASSTWLNPTSMWSDRWSASPGPAAAAITSCWRRPGTTWAPFLWVWLLCSTRRTSIVRICNSAGNVSRPALGFKSQSE